MQISKIGEPMFVGLITFVVIISFVVTWSDDWIAGLIAAALSSILVTGLWLVSDDGP